MQERVGDERHEARQSDFTPETSEPVQSPCVLDSTEQRDRLPQLALAVHKLLDALDHCAGDPPDCPHCGPARSFALDLLNPKPGYQNLPAEQTQNLQPATEQIRLSLAGRVGADPTFRVTPKGTIVGRFPLAIHNPDNTTTWEQVLTFNARAEKLKDAIHKGDAVQVVGYMHEREGKGREGQPKTIQELYAVTVTARAK